ncbi:hypothetical protein JX266_005062 [Neoarthrinium moseri]|nr:hypothetical protein JX266_005062 [Neoarthrinium moseri]
MLPTVTLAVGVIATTYMFLRLLLRLTQDAREPPAIVTGLPFLSPIIGMIREKSRFHVRLRRQWRTVSFAAIAAAAGSAVGMSKEAVRVMHLDLTSENGFSVSWPRYIMPSMGPGKDLDAINRKSVEVLANEMETLRAQGTVRLGISRWSRQTMVTTTTEAVWGPQNPYRDLAVAEAWKTLKAGFLAFSMFPLSSVFFPKLLRAREVIAAAMMEYMRKGGHKSSSGLCACATSTTTSSLAWISKTLLQVLADIRREVSALVYEGHDADNGTVHSIDLAGIRTSRPILMSTFQETMHFRAVNPGPRVLLEDVDLGGRYLLKKGSMLMIPATVQHADVAAWADDAGQFDHLRFARKPGTRKKKPNRVGLRAFGGGHILCPGRHFTSTEIMAFAVLLVLQFNVVPVSGKWV